MMVRDARISDLVRDLKLAGRIVQGAPVAKPVIVKRVKVKPVRAPKVTRNPVTESERATYRAVLADLLERHGPPLQNPWSRKLLSKLGRKFARMERRTEKRRLVARWVAMDQERRKNLDTASWRAREKERVMRRVSLYRHISPSLLRELE
jgi:hypothetical protein